MSKSLKPKKVDFNELTRMLEAYESKYGYSTPLSFSAATRMENWVMMMSS